MQSDAEILARYRQSKDNKYVGVLFKKYQRDVFGIAYYYLRDYNKSLDVVSDVFLIIMNTLHEKEVQNFKSWALAICRNQSLKKLRDDKTFTELTNSLEIIVDNNDEKVYSNELIDKISELIQELKEYQKLCIEQFYLKGKSYAMIAEENQLSLKEVKSHIQNGKRKLKILMNQFR